ncbi:MAG TPA: Gfo/Idh/MocA family oxidoreductase [Candidatus Latescibacteria bacterium]|nr:Gfo/Idh/MocA family oxidoreductase [Candidatus Latescibacterota bacterium]
MRVGIVLRPESAHRDIYLSVLYEMDEVGEVAVCDETGVTFGEAEGRLGGKLVGRYRDMGELLERGRPEMALVTLEAFRAPEAIKLALDAGVPVLAEKPACVDVGDFERLVRKAEEKGLPLMLAFAMRRSPMVLKAKELVEGGDFGRIYGVQAHFIADQTRIRDRRIQESWFFRKALGGGGHLLWLGCHFVDMISFVTGRRIRKVAGFTSVVGGQPIDVEDAAAVSLELEEGAVGNLLSAYFLDKDKHSLFALWGEHGWLRMCPHEWTPLEWYSDLYTLSPLRRLSYQEGAWDVYLPFVRSCVQACRGEEPPPIAPREGLYVLKVIHAAYKAAETGKTQEVGL